MFREAITNGVVSKPYWEKQVNHGDPVNVVKMNYIRKIPSAISQNRDWTKYHKIKD